MTEDIFQEMFNEAPTYSEKERVLRNSEFKDDVEYNHQLNDFKELLEVEADYTINQEIDSRKYTLYTCITDVYDSNEDYRKDVNYPVFIDDVASSYRDLHVDEISEELKNYVNGIKPIYWIVSDNGIGTLKRKKVFEKDFYEFFIEAVL